MADLYRKSSLERPSPGKVYYNSRDMESLDLKELRKHFGAVLQGGKLISGSIYENITVSAPAAKLDDVRRAVEEVGLKDDIAAMPMGLHTVLNEDGSAISGGADAAYTNSKSDHKPSGDSLF